MDACFSFFSCAFFCALGLAARAAVVWTPWIAGVAVLVLLRWSSCWCCISRVLSLSRAAIMSVADGRGGRPRCHVISGRGASSSPALRCSSSLHCCCCNCFPCIGIGRIKVRACIGCRFCPRVYVRMYISCRLLASSNHLTCLPPAMYC